MSVGIRKVEREDFASVVNTLTRAFDDDPWFNFIVTPDRRRAQRGTAWYSRGLSRILPFGECYMAEGYRGAALFAPPGGAKPSPFIEDLKLRRALITVSGWNRVEEVRRSIRELQAVHYDEPHWRLGVLAVDPEYQGQGLASALVRPVLERCDAAGMPVSLNCTKAKNVPLYEHFGFRVAHEVRTPGGPVLWSMWRDPRPVGTPA